MKRIVIKVIVIISIVIIGFCVYFFTYYYKNQDVENVKIEGYVLDSNSYPLNEVSVVIYNERYENDNGFKNFDEYLGFDKVELQTDNRGYYSTTLKKSAYVYIILRKEGYNSLEEKGQYATKVIRFKSFLQKK